MRSVSAWLVCLVLATAPAAHGQPANDDCSAATVIGTIPFADSVDVSAATQDAGDPVFRCDLGLPAQPHGSTVWYRYTAPAAVHLEIATFGSDYDTIVGAFRGSCGGLTLAFCNDTDPNENRPDGPASGEDSRLFMTLEAGESVYVVVGDSGSAGVPGTLVLDVQETPLFVANGFESTYYPQPAVATSPSGDFLVVWAARVPFDEVIRGRLFDAAGLPKGPVLDLATADDTFRPDVAADGTGSFVVVWGDYGSPDRIMARRIDSAGTPLGAPFQVNVGSVYAYPAVGADAAGNFVVSWSTGSNIAAQRFDTSDTGLVADLAVGVGRFSALSVAADGDFVIAWGEESGLDGSGYGVAARRYDATATALGAPFVVNTYTTGSQGPYGPDVALTPAGDFVVVWTTGYDQTPGILRSVQGRFFDGAGAPLGGEFQVNTGVITYGYYGSDYGDDANDHPTVAADGDGEFVVVWHRAYSGPYGRRLDASATPTGGEFQVSTFWRGYQAAYRTDVAMTSNGDFTVVWSDPDFNTATEVFGRAFPAATPPADCPAAPRSGCKLPTQELKGRLSMKDKSADKGDSIVWKWVKGEETTGGDLGDPLAADGFTFCLYGSGGQLLSEASVDPGGTCGTRPCWKALGDPPGSTGYLYKNGPANEDGAQKLVAKPGLEGKAKTIFKGHGVNLAMPTIPVTLPLTAQLASSTGTCWSAEFRADGVVRNEPGVFTAKASVPASPAGAFLD
jgi:hypothetical protein